MYCTSTYDCYLNSNAMIDMVLHIDHPQKRERLREQNKLLESFYLLTTTEKLKKNIFIVF